MEIKSRKRYSEGFKRKGMEEFRDETMPGGAAYGIWAKSIRRVETGRGGVDRKYLRTGFD